MSTEVPLIDATDAMVVTIVATEAMLLLPWDDMPKDQARGASLLYDKMLQRVTPFLPNLYQPEMAHVLSLVQQARKLADAIRDVQ